MAKTKELKPLSSTPGTITPFSRFNGHPFYQDETSKKKFIGSWTPPIFPEKETDIIYTIPAEYAFRPDLIAYEYYDSPYLAWVIAYVNNILNPFDRTNGFYAGRVIRIPDIITVTTMLNF